MQGKQQAFHILIYYSQTVNYYGKIIIYCNKTIIFHNKALRLKLIKRQFSSLKPKYYSKVIVIGGKVAFKSAGNLEPIPA